MLEKLKRNRRVGIPRQNCEQLAAIDTRAMAVFRLKVNRAPEERVARHAFCSG